MKLISWECITMKLTSKKTWCRRKEQVLRKGSYLIQHVQNMAYQKIYTFWYYVINDEIPSTFSQSFNKLRLFKKSFYQEYLSWITKQQTRNKETKHNFLRKFSRKRKMDLILPIIFPTTPIDGSCYRVIDSSNIQELFPSFPKFLSCNEEKTLE